LGGEKTHRHMSNQRARQKKLEKQKKKRAAAKKRANEIAKRIPEASAGLARRTAAWPVYEAYLSSNWKSDEPAGIVSAILVRQNSDGRTVFSSMLVDRTCLGLKDGFARLMSHETVRDYIDQLGMIQPIERVDLATLQSVVYHAVDYARALGFEAHKDLPLEFVGPRPEPLQGTPLAKRDRPYFVSGPDDDVAAVVTQLERAVGAGNFDVVIGSDVVGGMRMLEDEDGFDDDESDEDVVEGEGEE
jgi:hypothetical protein